MRVRDYNNLVDAYQNLKYDLRLEDRARTSKQVSGTRTTGVRTYRTRDSTAPSYSATPTPKGKPLTRVDLPAKYRDVPALLTPEMRTKYISEKRCWTCGEVGHTNRSLRCPLKDFKQLFAEERNKATQVNTINVGDSDEDFNQAYSDEDRASNWSSGDESAGEA